MELVVNNFSGGDVYSISIEEIDKFYEENISKFSRAGVSSFLKALKIPVNYFLKQPLETQLELLVNQKQSSAPNIQLLILNRSSVIEFVSICNPEYFLGLKERASESNEWISIEEDLISGYHRYFMPSEPIKNGEYIYGVFIDYPILFSKPMLINLGFYKVESNSDDVDKEIIVPNTTIKLKKDCLPETEHNIYFLDLISSADALKAVKNFLENTKINEDEVIPLLLSFEKEKLMSRSHSKLLRKYIDKEGVVITNLMGLVELSNLFVPNFKTFSAKFKLKQSVVNSLLVKHNNKLNVDFIQEFSEGY